MMLDRMADGPGPEAYKQETYDLVGVAPGHRILNLGCSTGEDILAMARQIGRSGEIVGVDPSETVVSEARKRAEGAGLPVSLVVANAASLPFPDNSFDGCRADRFFQHRSDPEAVLAELVRVCKPGAPVVVTDPDYGSAVLDADDRALARKVQAFLSDLTANPWSGRRLRGMFQRAGLTDLLVRVGFWPFNLAELKDQFQLSVALQMMQEQGLITETEAQRFLHELESRSVAGTFFGGVSFFIVAGHKEI